MLDCQVAWLEHALARFSVTGITPGPIGSRHPSITPFQAFRAADGHFVAGCGNEAIWGRFCDAIELSELKSDARFRLNVDRTANHAELEPILMRHFAAHPRAYWLERVRGANGSPTPDTIRHEGKRNQHMHYRSIV